MISKCMSTLLVLLTLGVTARAQDASTRTQEASPRESSRATAPAVTVSVTERGVRFAALGSFGKMRLEVFNADGTSLYNSDFAAASVRDWVLDNKDGQLLPDGTYLCVITIRDLSGRLSTKQGSVVLQGGQPSLKLPDGESVQVIEPDRSLARVTDSPDNALTLISHDGDNGQVVNTRGALTFRSGDFFGGRDKELMRLTPEGNLGIGTSKPEFELDVAGAIRARGGFVFNDGSGLNVNDKGALVLTSSNGKGVLALTNGGTITPNVAGTGTQNQVAKWTDNTGTLGDSAISESSGNIGIGTVSPNVELELATGGVENGLRITGTGGVRTDWWSTNANAGARNWSARIDDIVFGDWALYQSNAKDGNPFTVGTARLYIKNNGNVGIGTTTPNAQLELATGGLENGLRITGTGGVRTDWWSTNANAGARNWSARIDDIVFGDWALYQSSAKDGNPFTAGTARVYVKNDGSVGIGTTNPLSLLDVNGNLNVTGNATISGNIAAKYQDIAEWTSARGALPSGTVVTLDPIKANSVMASNKRYDTRVAGVVSAQPGVILGEGGPNRILVATTGRVRVSVDASRHPIHIGDLLVTSDTPGVAMKSQPFRVHGKIMHRPGTIIGKALEPLSSGQRTILVLLSLQ